MATSLTPASAFCVVTSIGAAPFAKGDDRKGTSCRFDENFGGFRQSASRSPAASMTMIWSQRRYANTPAMVASRTEIKKIAKLNVKKRKTIPLPAFSDALGQTQHISVFLQEPEGMECMLNTKALRKYESIGEGVYRCYLPPLELLSFQVAPVIDLTVDAKDDCCQVDLISCKFEGSKLVRSQNERFSASLKNHLAWSGGSKEGQQQDLHVGLELNVALEVYTQPFKSLPISAVETPGNLILQALVDRLLPLFLDQLLTDYRAWAESKGGQARLDQKATNEMDSHT